MTKSLQVVELGRRSYPMDCAAESASGGWLRASQQEIREVDHNGAVDHGGPLPMILGLAVLGIGIFICFVIFW